MARKKLDIDLNDRWNPRQKELANIELGLSSAERSALKQIMKERVYFEKLVEENKRDLLKWYSQKVDSSIDPGAFCAGCNWTDIMRDVGFLVRLIDNRGE